MKKLVTLMALAAVLTLGLGNALAFTEFNPILGPNTDADFERMYGEGGPVAHSAGWNVEAVGPLPAEMEAAYGNGSAVSPAAARICVP